MTALTDIKPFTSSLNKSLIDESDLYFESSTKEWTKAIDKEGYEYEYKECGYYTFSKSKILELIAQKFAFNLLIRGSEYHFTMIKKY